MSSNAVSVSPSKLHKSIGCNFEDEITHEDQLIIDESLFRNSDHGRKEAPDRGQYHHLGALEQQQYSSNRY